MHFPIGYVLANKLPTPGAMAYAYDINSRAQKPLIGPGIGVRRPMRATVPAGQQFYRMSWVSGLGGLASGNFVLQPLIDPYRSG